MKKIIIIILSSFILFIPVYCQAEYLFPFEGEVDFLQKKIIFRVNSGQENFFAIFLTQKNEDQYEMTVNIEHLKIPLIEVSTILESLIEIKEKKAEGTPSCEGKLWSRYTLINYKPIKELKGQFELKNDKLYLHSLIAGNLSMKGYFQVSPPYTISLSLQIASMNLDDFIFFFTKKKLDAHGKVNGKINIEGNLEQIYLRGTLSSYNGMVKNLGFQDILLNVDGVYPQIHIKESVVTKQDGLIFYIDGVLDLSDSKNFEKQIKSLKKRPLIKKDGEHAEWTFKRIKAKDSSRTMELKYLLRQDGDHSSSTPAAGSNMLGVEQKLSF